MDFNKTLALIPDDFEPFVFPELDCTVTGAELRRKSGVLAAWLQEKGYTVIGIHMPNCPEFLYLFTGALRAGVKTVLFNALKKADGEIPIFDREKTAELRKSLASAPAAFVPYDWGLDEPFLYMSTSGTSGIRKMVAKSLQSFFGRKGFRPLWRLMLKPMRFRIYNCSPWYHNTGLYLLLIQLCGSMVKQIAAAKYNPNNMRLNIERTRPNVVLSTPTMLTRCVASGEMSVPPYLICTGEYLPPETITLLEERGGAEGLANCYGTTETGPVSNMLYIFDDIRLKSRPLEAIVRVMALKNAVFDKKTFRPNCMGVLMKNVSVKVMRDGRELDEGEPGELYIKSNTMYENRENDYCGTGDVGYLKDGFLYVSGRSANVINRSGEKILAHEVESVLMGMTGVQAAVVFGIPSGTHGEDICAAIESENAAPVVTEEALKERMPKHMIPQQLLFFEKLPMTESGKTNLSALRDYAMK